MCFVLIKALWINWYMACCFKFVCLSVSQTLTLPVNYDSYMFIFGVWFLSSSTFRWHQRLPSYKFDLDLCLWMIPLRWQSFTTHIMLRWFVNQVSVTYIVNVMQRQATWMLGWTVSFVMSNIWTMLPVAIVCPQCIPSPQATKPNCTALHWSWWTSLH